jgi:proteasome lid subunit RPN8/RPN11
MTLEEGVKAKIVEHAKEHCPNEVCGLIVIRKGKQIYWPCKNLANGSDQFILDPEDYSKADEAGDIVAVVHSHPNMSAKPSQADLVACEASGLPWFIIGLPDEIWEYFEPNGYVAPLVGRKWSHGVLDCYSIIRDWYKQERGIELLNFNRSDGWWNEGENLYLDNFAKAGFYEIKQDDLQEGDVILMKIVSPVPNHGAIYLGDGIILHHVHGRLSTREVFGGYWLKNSAAYLRYENSNSSR